MLFGMQLYYFTDCTIKKKMILTPTQEYHQNHHANNNNNSPKMHYNYYRSILDGRFLHSAGQVFIKNIRCNFHLLIFGTF